MYSKSCYDMSWTTLGFMALQPIIRSIGVMGTDWNNVYMSLYGRQSKCIRNGCLGVGTLEWVPRNGNLGMGLADPSLHGGPNPGDRGRLEHKTKALCS